MKKILILSDGPTAKHFIDRVIDTYSSENIYYVVEMRKQQFKEYNPARFKFYEFDPTSFSKISNLLKMDFIQVVIALDTPHDVENSLKNIRSVNSNIRVVILDLWGLNINDSNAVVINANEQLSSRILDYLPNVPVIAQNVGLGEGEIMEVLVPFGSTFVYRHLGVIKQKDWKITAIYRNHKLILPRDDLMIQPNDVLLLVGEVSVLKSVYLSIKQELGQFPAPFGEDIYLLIDMNLENFASIQLLIENAVIVMEKFNKKLLIRVVNVNDLDALRYIKEFKDINIIVEISFRDTTLTQLIEDDVRKWHIGLVLISCRSFEYEMIKSTLYKMEVPVLKFADRTFDKIKEAIVLLNENRNVEKISTTVFDVSVQMNFNLELVNYILENQDDKTEVIEHYQNLSTIFSKKIKLNEIEKNPIRYLKSRSSFLYCLPFSKVVTQNPLFAFLSTDSEKLYFKLDEYHQLFIPSGL